MTVKFLWPNRLKRAYDTGSRFHKKSTGVSGSVSRGTKTPVDLNFISGSDFEFDPPAIRFDSRRVLPIALGVISPSIVRENALVPIEARDRLIVLAIAYVPDENDREFRELMYKLRFVCNREFELAVVTCEALQYARTRYLLGERC